MSEMMANMERLGEIDYSTEEQWTGKYWIDGNKVYIKVLTGTTPSSSGDADVFDLSACNIGTIIKLDIMYYYLPSKTWHKANGHIHNNTATLTVYYDSNTKKLKMSAATAWQQSQSFHGIIKYTKAT